VSLNVGADVNVTGDLRVGGGSPWFDVTHPDFGAVGDGVADDTAAIQEAIDAAEVAGGGVFLPIGAYKTTSPLTMIGNAIRLQGAHMLGTEIRYYGGASPIIDVGDNATQWTDVKLDGFRLRDYGGSATIGIRARKIDRLTLGDITLTALGTTGLDLSTVLWGEYRNVHVRATTIGANLVACQQNQFFGGSLIRSSVGAGTGLAIDSTSNTVDLFGTGIENYTTWGIDCSGDLCRFFGPRFDGVTNEVRFNSGAAYNALIWPSTSKSPASTIVVTDLETSGTNTLITPGHLKVAGQAAAEFGSNVRLRNNVALQGRNVADSSWLGLIQLTTGDLARIPRTTTIDGTLSVAATAAIISSGTGSPEGVLTAPVGSIFLRTDAATSLYVKQTGAGNTGWVAK
jgi:hypothetical protein